MSGTNLTGTGNILVTAPTNYEVSLNNSTFSASVNVAYSSATLSSTPIYVRLKSGLNIGTYNSSNISHTGGGATSINVTCSGTVSDVIVTSECGNETFTNIPTDSPSSYLTRTWTGDDGKSWSATSARTDQIITGKAITFKNGVITSASTSAGISSLTFNAKLPFTESSGSLTIAVNGTTIGTIAISEMSGTTTISKTFTNIDIEGDIVITLTSATARFSIDDLTWTCYNSTGIEKTNSLNNEFVIYPNPNNGSFSIKSINNSKISNIIVRDITGKNIYTKSNFNSADINLKVSSGIYFVEIQTDNNNLIQKIVIQ